MDRVLFLSWLLLVSQTAALLLLFILLVRRQGDKKQNKITEEIKEPQTFELETQINSLQNELEKTKADTVTAQNELEKLKKEKSGLDEQVTGYEAKVNSLQDELEKTKTSYTATQNELQELKEVKSDLDEELRSLKDSQRANDAERELLKKENLDLEAKLESKEQESEKIITQNLMAPPKTQKPPEARRDQKKQKIGEILLAHDFITRDILDKALEHQEKYGGNLSQYLLAYGYIDESKLAQCLCTQFGIPYLPLRAYHIPDEIIKLVPVDIAEKYWLVPVDKIGNSVTVVMTDPLDSKAAKEIEEITGCTVRPFVGILSEIIDALETYYKIVIKTKGLKSAVPFFIDTKSYKGPERRQSIRYNVRIDVHFSIQGLYKKSVTKNVSREGLSLESDSPLPIGLLITLQIDLPREVSPLPIAAIVQVVRVFPLENNKFDIGVKIMKISKQELDTVLQYAVAYK